MPDVMVTNSEQMLPFEAFALATPPFLAHRILHRASGVARCALAASKNMPSKKTLVGKTQQKTMCWVNYFHPGRPVSDIKGESMTIFKQKVGHESAWARALGIALLAFGLSVPAFAALGGDLSSVHADQANMKASLKTTINPAYTMHEIKTPMGTIVHEFASADGKVFGVAWRGPSMPPMQQILGTYFQQFSDEVQAHHSPTVHRAPLNIQTPGLVVQSNGHPRGYFGRAYVPGMLPQGVTPAQIQ